MLFIVMVVVSIVAIIIKSIRGMGYLIVIMTIVIPMEIPFAVVIKIKPVKQTTVLMQAVQIGHVPGVKVILIKGIKPILDVI